MFALSHSVAYLENRPRRCDTTKDVRYLQRGRNKQPGFGVIAKASGDGIKHRRCGPEDHDYGCARQTLCGGRLTEAWVALGEGPHCPSVERDSFALRCVTQLKLPELFPAAGTEARRLCLTAVTVTW